MNLQTMVDTLKEVRALRGPDQERLVGEPCGQEAQPLGGKAGGSSQHSPYSVLPPAASVSP